MIHPVNSSSATMVRGRQPLGRILLRREVITEAQLRQATDYQLERACRLGEALVTLGLCSEVDLARALAEQIEVPFVDLRSTPPPPELLSLIPREVAIEHGVLPVAKEHGRLLVVALNAADIRLDEILLQCTGMPVLVGVAPEGQIREHLIRCYRVIRQHTDPVQALELSDAGELEVIEEHEVAIEKLLDAGDEISATQILSTIMSHAVRKDASDIHIEPQEGGVRVRFRIDGTLVSTISFEKRLLPSVSARSKVMCGMDLTENRKPQDGGCRVRVDGNYVELRASVLPGVSGEVIVFRILARDSKLHRIDSLGMSPSHQQTLRQLLAAPSGMILVTGPTGSGKTTSLYAAIDHLNREDVNIVTVEDPVELRIPSINQTQVDDKAGRTFAGTLRSMLRQDPDIIMVGEIRDTETVEIACRAALTGHLVLSTLHTRGAVGTLSRLSDMGVSRYTLAASLNAVISQRLVPRICSKCGADYEPAPAILEFLQASFGSLAGATFRKGRGCASCRETGTQGRIGVYEILCVEGEIGRLIAQGVDLEELGEAARARGFRSLEEDAFEKACQGLIAPEEVLKLCAWTAPKSES